MQQPSNTRQLHGLCFIGSSSPAAGLQLEGLCLLHPAPPASCWQDLRPVPRCPGRRSYRNGVKPHGAQKNIFFAQSKTLWRCWLGQTWSSVPSSITPGPWTRGHTAPWEVMQAAAVSCAAGGDPAGFVAWARKVQIALAEKAMTKSPLCIHVSRVSVGTEVYDTTSHKMSWVL